MAVNNPRPKAREGGEPVLPPQAQAAQRRIMVVATAELARMDLQAVTELAAMTDAELLARLAVEVVEQEPLRVSRRARMRLKGAVRFAKLIEVHGGAYSARQAADLLGTSIEAVKKAAQRRALLAFKRQGQWWFPVWQFGDDGEVLPGLTRVLKALPKGVGEHDAVRFFLARSEGEAASTPLELVCQGDEHSLALAERKAERFMEQLAA